MVDVATPADWNTIGWAMAASIGAASLSVIGNAAETPAHLGVWGASERKTYVRPCRATCRGASPFCDIHLRQKCARPAWGLVAVAELRSGATDPQSLSGRGLHRFSVRLLPRPHLLCRDPALSPAGELSDQCNQGACHIATDLNM